MKCTKNDKVQVNNETEDGKKVWISLSMYEVTDVLLVYNRSKKLVHVNQFKKPSPTIFSLKSKFMKPEDVVGTENEIGTNGMEFLVSVGSDCCNVIQQVKKIGLKVKRVHRNHHLPCSRSTSCQEER